MESTFGSDALRHRAFGILALIALVLAGCAGGGSQPFAKVDGSPSGKPVPPISIGTVNGLPTEKFQALKDALSISAGKRDMAIVEGAFDQGGFSLAGNFQIIPDPSAVRVGYNWTLTDKSGAVLHSIAAEEIAPGTPGPDPWAQVTPAVLQRIAAYTAENLSGRLSQMGYATQIGGLPPPLDGFMMAGPGAENDLDYETLNGPGWGERIAAASAAEPEKAVGEQQPPVEDVEATPPKAVATARQNDDNDHVDDGAFGKSGKGDLALLASGGEAGGKGDLVKVSHRSSLKPRAKPANNPPPAKLATVASEPPPAKLAKAASEPPPPPPKGGAQPIKAVAVIPVSGSPGRGNSELTKAMRRMLEDAGWPVLSAPRSDALTISGKVALAAPAGSMQKVALAWTVKSPDGRMIGSVKQANRVPAGSLDERWGQNADYAAEAAATGIFDLVKKIR